MWSYDPDNLENLRGFITFGDHARIGASMAEELWNNLEASFIDNGERLGLEGELLKVHVEQRLQQYAEREERSARRREEALRTEFAKTLKEINERIANAQEGEGKATMGGTEESPSHSGGRQPVMKIPSYDGTQHWSVILTCSRTSVPRTSSKKANGCCDCASR